METLKPTVLVVDDSDSNIEVLLETLSGDYRVRVATDGPAALRAVEKALPDLVLLDIMMPGMDGFEVCRRLKADPAACRLPVIFLTAVADGEGEARGLEMGAVDYITKPINPAIVRIRVRNHLDLKAHRDALEDLVAQRTRQLAEAHNRLKAVDAARQEFLFAISHELRTPANGLLGIADLAVQEIVDEEQRAWYLKLLSESRQRLLTTIDAALEMAQLQSDGGTIATVPVDLAAATAAVSRALEASFVERGLTLDVPRSAAGRVLGQDALVRQSVTTLLQVAQRLAARGTTVHAEVSDEPARATLRLLVHGSPMSDNLQRTFFDTFSYDRSGSYAEDLGLAVPLAAHVVRAMGGDVSLRSAPSGLEIVLTLVKGPGETAPQ
jgi:two-component system, sensor histidine kinase and response regulator